MTISYKIHFSNGKISHLDDVACFSDLLGLKDSVEFSSCFDDIYLRDGSVWPTKIVYKPELNSGVSEVASDNLITYLFTHRIWGKAITNRSIESIKSNGFYVSTNVTPLLLFGTLTAIRYLEEDPVLVNTFLGLTSLDYNFVQDLSFYLSHFIALNKVGKMVRHPSRNTNHSLFLKQRHGIRTGIFYLTEPHQMSSGRKYRETLSLPSLSEYYELGIVDESQRVCLSNIKDVVNKINVGVKKYGSNSNKK